MPNSKRLAHCACGALKAKTLGHPELVAACSCVQCQRRSGTFIAVAGYWKRNKVTITGPAKPFLRNGDSGGGVELFFCPSCGSTLYWLIRDLRPGWVAIAAGMFAAVDFPQPSVSVWEGSKPGWISVSADVHLAEQPLQA
jgi:hypothetical protein